MRRRLKQWRADRRVLIALGVTVVAAVLVTTTALVGGESEAYGKGRDVGVALFETGTPIEKCANVRQGARLPGLDTVDKQTDFYEGCLAGYEDVADDR